MRIPEPIARKKFRRNNGLIQNFKNDERYFLKSIAINKRNAIKPKIMIPIYNSLQQR